MFWRFEKPSTKFKDQSSTVALLLRIKSFAKENIFFPIIQNNCIWQMRQINGREIQRRSRKADLGYGQAEGFTDDMVLEKLYPEGNGGRPVKDEPGFAEIQPRLPDHCF
jgi:hypothetical protein